MAQKLFRWTRYVTSGWKDHHYVGKVDGKSQYVQKQYHMWTFNIAKASSLIKNESSFEFSFGKKIKFHQLYEYNKSSREYLYKRDIPQSSYLCKIYYVCFVAKAWIKQSRAVTWYQRIPIHCLKNIPAILLQELACFQKMNVVTLLVRQWSSFRVIATMQGIMNGIK